MPDVSIPSDQYERLQTVCDDLEAIHVGAYGTVRPIDAIEYLLDTYSPPDSEAGQKELNESSSESTDLAGAGEGSELEAVTDIDGVGEVTADALAEAGFPTIDAIRTADSDELTAADGVGSNQAADIVAAVAASPAETSKPASQNTTATGDATSRSAVGSTAESAAATLQQAMSLLDAHDGKWREASGDAPYEVDLPDGSVEPVRTKDDIKRLLFQHWE